MSSEPIPWLKLCRFFERVGNGKKAGGKITKFPDKEKREFFSCTVLAPSRTFLLVFHALAADATPLSWGWASLCAPCHAHPQLSSSRRRVFFFQERDGRRGGLFEEHRRSRIPAPGATSAAACCLAVSL